ncbi:hypothetical protein HMPREF9720_1012 [Alistipes sp. HGB5]|nr:hypothetical protein HMPREF9720_1012 [Alistipes sp. HGB5]
MLKSRRKHPAAFFASAACFRADGLSAFLRPTLRLFSLADTPLAFPADAPPAFLCRLFACFSLPTLRLLFSG